MRLIIKVIVCISTTKINRCANGKWMIKMQQNVNIKKNLHDPIAIPILCRHIDGQMMKMKIMKKKENVKFA